jgi:hypothetical protein
MMASARGLLGGRLLAGTVRLITDTATIRAWTVAGLRDWARFGLAAAELLGAVLFAVEPLIVAGFVLLVGSFVFAAAVHGQGALAFSVLRTCGSTIAVSLVAQPGPAAHL